MHFMLQAHINILAVSQCQAGNSVLQFCAFTSRPESLMLHDLCSRNTEAGACVHAHRL